MPQSLKPSVCIDAVLEGQSLSDSLALVSNAGIQAFEFWCWWEKDLDQLCQLREQYKLDISACCTKFVSLVDPAVRGDYLTGLEESIDACRRINCKTLISQVGDFRPGVPRQQQHQSLVDGLCEAAALLESAGITLVIEPLNELIDHAGYYLVRSDEAFEIIDEVGSANVKIIYDIYHQQISEGQLIANIQANIDKIAHFHAAGNPGRNELTRGEIHYPSIFDAIRETTYEGYVALEYWPKDDPRMGLEEVASWFSSR